MRAFWRVTLVLMIGGCSSTSDSPAPAIPSSRIVAAMPTVVPTLILPTPAPPLAIATPTLNAQQEKEQLLIHEQLLKMQNADPAADVEAAWQRRDFRFLDLRIEWDYVLGVEKGIKNPLVAKYGVRIIEGGSDFITSDEHLQFQQLARQYSTRYNRLLHQRLTGETQRPALDLAQPSRP